MKQVENELCRLIREVGSKAARRLLCESHWPNEAGSHPQNCHTVGPWRYHNQQNVQSFAPSSYMCSQKKFLSNMNREYIQKSSHVNRNTT
jgi:hypothetical protein